MPRPSVGRSRLSVGESRGIQPCNPWIVIGIPLAKPGDDDRGGPAYHGPMTALEPLDRLIERVPNGALVALAPEYSWVPMAAVRALIRRRVKNLHLLTVPIGGLAADLLIGAGAVGTLESAGVTLGEAGQAPRFCEAVETGA